METYVKLCPDCTTITALQVARCHECGHVYRTRFDPATGQILSRRRASAARARGITGMREIHEMARVAVRGVRLILAYVGPLAIVLWMNLWKDCREAPVLLPLLGLVTVTWLWYLSDAG